MDINDYNAIPPHINNLHIKYQIFNGFPEVGSDIKENLETYNKFKHDNYLLWEAVLTGWVISDDEKAMNAGFYPEKIFLVNPRKKTPSTKIPIVKGDYILKTNDWFYVDHGGKLIKSLKPSSKPKRDIFDPCQNLEQYRKEGG